MDDIQQEVSNTESINQWMHMLAVEDPHEDLRNSLLS